MGRPRKPRQLKVIDGTHRPDRDDVVVAMPLLDDVPAPPDWLPNAHATKEFNRLAPILHRVGLLTEAGLSAFAHLCSLHGKIVQLYAAGESPTGHMLAQYRNLVNDFGLTPVAQGKVRPSGETQKENRFAKNGKRKS